MNLRILSLEAESIPPSTDTITSNVQCSGREQTGSVSEHSDWRILVVQQTEENRRLMNSITVKLSRSILQRTRSLDEVHPEGGEPEKTPPLIEQCLPVNIKDTSQASDEKYLAMQQQSTHPVEYENSDPDHDWNDHGGHTTSPSLSLEMEITTKTKLHPFTLGSPPMSRSAISGKQPIITAASTAGANTEISDNFLSTIWDRISRIGPLAAFRNTGFVNVINIISSVAIDPRGRCLKLVELAGHAPSLSASVCCAFLGNEQPAVRLWENEIVHFTVGGLLSMLLRAKVYIQRWRTKAVCWQAPEIAIGRVIGGLRHRKVSGKACALFWLIPIVIGTALCFTLRIKIEEEQLWNLYTTNWVKRIEIHQAEQYKFQDLR
ncbi:hypothetical protein AAF712_001530 [Marasmius tenuissimus]|uniref:Transmembrane protein n=1 Tax=Marasmius tenuissimus TaxID=585030 RepID=A0ABR3AF80_9AGAR